MEYERAREGQRVFTCVGMKKTFLMVLAYLLDKGFLEKRSLVFFIDGASNLLSNIAEMFAFHPYRVISRVRKRRSGRFKNCSEFYGRET